MECGLASDPDREGLWQPSLGTDFASFSAMQICGDKTSSGSYRILMVAPTPFFADRGCHVRILEEARALQALGHEVVIVTYHNGRDVPGVQTIRMPHVPWYKKLEAGPSVHKYYLDQLLLAKTVSTALRFRPDILHGHLHEGALVARTVSLVLKVPVVMDCQGSLTDELVAHRFLKRGGLHFRLMKAVERAVVRSANAVIVSSTRTADFLIQDLGVPAQRVHVVHDGADTNVFRPDRSVSHVRRAWGIPPDASLVIYLGALTRYQGIDHLLEAVPHVLACHPEARFLICGYPETHYRARAAQAGLADRVIFTGRISYFDTPDYLAAADIAVAPKLETTEANGKVYYYMASGLPTVVFDQPINRDMLGDLGLYARMGDASSLAKQICLPMEDPELARRLSTQVRQLAVERYSWTAAANKILAVYQSLTGRLLTAPAATVPR
ncbi:MAG: glycosyltransferase family 4 protein [Armatimonadota bacterium]